MAAIIGIDLGTTNSVLAYLRGGAEVINIKGRPSLPSVVAYNGEFLVGAAAKSLAASSDNVIVSPKRMMGSDHKYTIAGRTLTPVNASAMILREIKQQAEAFLGEKVDSAVITIPAYFGGQQVDNTRKAAAEAGLKVAKLLAEPVAACATYNADGEETTLVFDLGGGTLDCTVIDMFDAKLLGLSGHNLLGGDNFDNRIVDRMLKILKEEQGLDFSTNEKAKVRLKQRAEEAKINLSEATSTQVEFIGKLDGKLCQVEFRLTRDEYNQMIDDLVTLAIEKADEAIARAKMEKSDIDVVLLVGGSTLTPYVQERLQAHFGKPPSKRVDPMLAVGLGAAISINSLAWDDKIHRIMLRSRAIVWSETNYAIKGRTTAGSQIEITGGATSADTTADAAGGFAADIQLKPSANNEITVKAVSPTGESATAVQRIRHDTGVAAVEPVQPSQPQATLPRSLMLGMKDDRIAEVVKHGATVPTFYEESERFLCSANAIPFTLTVPVYEGALPEHEIPYGPFNARLGTLEVKCPPTSSDTPLVVSFEIDDSRTLTFKCWFKDDPSVFQSIVLKSESVSRDRKHLLDRVENTLNDGGERIRPDERTRINHKKQALIDLCEQYAATQEMSPESEELRGRVIATGNELKQAVEALEKKHNL